MGVTHLVRTVPVLRCQVALHGGRLRNLNGLHAVVVQTKHLSSSKTYHKALQVSICMGQGKFTCPLPEPGMMAKHLYQSLAGLHAMCRLYVW